MTGLKLAVSGIWLSLPMMLTAQAQVSVDISKITCEQYTTEDDDLAVGMAVWLSGYFSAKRGDTLFDLKHFHQNAEKVENYCKDNPKKTVMQAVEILLTAGK